MANTTIHGFSETGELSRGAAIALEAYWNSRIRENGGGGAGGVLATDLNNGYTEITGVGGGTTDLNNGYTEIL